MRKIIIIVLALATVSGFLFWKFGPQFSKKPEVPTEVTLNILGLWDEENLLKSAFDQYKKDHPNVKINYTFTTSKNYFSRVQTKIEQNEELDILMIHNSWLPMFLKTSSLGQMPDQVMSFSDFSKAFYPIVTNSFTKDGKIYGIPRGIDGLALFYNEDILKSTGVEVPQTWEQFKSSAVKMTVVDSQGQIQTSGAALGTASNVDHFSDILGLLFYQNPGADLKVPNSDAGAEVINFYTSFVLDKDQKTWDPTLETSTQAFASGRLAFYFAPSWRAHELRQANPELKFKTAPVPQLPGKNIGWGTFWGYGVSSKSKHPQEAWEFLKFFTSSETQKKLYQQASGVRLFGLPYSRVELASELADDPIVGSFVNQAPTYKGWYLSSKTFDQAINDNIIKYYEDALNSVLAGSDAKGALETTAKGVQQVLEQYSLATPKPIQ